MRPTTREVAGLIRQGGSAALTEAEKKYEVSGRDEDADGRGRKSLVKGRKDEPDQPIFEW
ncbi:MAG: hypothetical protein A3F70_01965 [Acidobacteria bacterium RIFCSPLOWO2_12_FULL_67_14]|nr:MAG: hypothetical protein A3H29_18715 [Acidobacteria bacterium RIFCSPLOWO2_02_FULL_67_21]OFW38899.1 MAG: hypothetical protein A3F70_01965 [Acidobacteria bacterium RIFCSPLOWO2_12_FULL_67_14]